MNHQIQEIAKKIIKVLKDKGFVIHRYDSYSSDSVYLKLDFGVCNTIRISDHEGKAHLRYRYNLIIGGENNIIEDTYIRYYFNEHNVKGLLYQILFDKKAKIAKYSLQSYRNFMIKNMCNHENDKGFWKNAKLVTGTNFGSGVLDIEYIDTVSGEPVTCTTQVPKSRKSSTVPVTLVQMSDGTYACGPDEVLNLYNDTVKQQMQLDANAKFHKNEKVKVTATFDELVAYYMTSQEPIGEAKAHALKILSKGFETEEYDVGTVIGATKCDEGMYYTLELPLIPMEFLPEEFISKI